MSDFCCKMRERFLIGIIAENPAIEIGAEVADFIDFDADGGVHPETGKPRPVIRIAWCPFCGTKSTGPLRVQKGEGDE